MTLNNTDTFLVNRGSNSYSLAAEDLLTTLQDTDLMLVNRSDQSYKATGTDIIDSIIDPLEIVATVEPTNPDSETLLNVLLDVSGGKLPYTYAYQWKYKTVADPTVQNISDVETDSYILTDIDIGRMIACEVTVTDSRNTTVSSISNFTAAVLQAVTIEQPLVISPPDGSGVGEIGRAHV